MLYILVNLTISGKSLATFFVAAEGSDQVRIFYLLVEVADKTATGQVGGCDFVERTDFLYDLSLPKMKVSYEKYLFH